MLDTPGCRRVLIVDSFSLVVFLVTRQPSSPGSAYKSSHRIARKDDLVGPPSYCRALSPMSGEHGSELHYSDKCVLFLQKCNPVLYGSSPSDRDSAKLKALNDAVEGMMAAR